MKTFVEIVNIAEKNRWCVQPFCTTCGSHEFRDELRKLSEDHEKGLVDALSAASVSALSTSLNWGDAVRLALGEINDAKDMDKVLKSWLPNLQSNIELADLVMFYFVKQGAIFAPMSVELLNKWGDACKELAIMTKNESLLESLIYSLGDRIEDDQELMKVIEATSIGSRKIQQAIKASTS